MLKCDNNSTDIIRSIPWGWYAYIQSYALAVATKQMLGGFPTRLAPDTLAHVKWRASFREPPALAGLTREITTAQFQGYLIWVHIQPLLSHTEPYQACRWTVNWVWHRMKQLPSLFIYQITAALRECDVHKHRRMHDKAMPQGGDTGCIYSTNPLRQLPREVQDRDW